MDSEYTLDQFFAIPEYQKKNDYPDIQELPQDVSRYLFTFIKGPGYAFRRARVRNILRRRLEEKYWFIEENTGVYDADQCCLLFRVRNYTVFFSFLFKPYICVDCYTTHTSHTLTKVSEIEKVIGPPNPFLDVYWKGIRMLRKSNLWIKAGIYILLGIGLGYGYGKLLDLLHLSPLLELVGTIPIGIGLGFWYGVTVFEK